MRKRRAAKWVGTALCGVILFVSVHSIWYFWCIETPAYELDIRFGRFCFFPGNDYYASVDRFQMPITHSLRGVLAISVDALRLPDSDAAPMWLPLLIIAIPTALLWWTDHRRHPPNHCQTCDYDLTGNVSGRCPECGSRV